MTAGFARLHATGDMNRTRKQQQFFGESGFTRVGVGDDRECAATFDFGRERRGHVGRTMCSASSFVKEPHYRTQQLTPPSGGFSRSDQLQLG